MLASTVQFSTTNQTPAPPPHQTQTPHTGPSGMRRRPALTKTTTPPPPRSSRHTDQPRTQGTTARSLRTQQRAYDHPTPPTPLHTTPPAKGPEGHPHGHVVVLGAGQDTGGRTGQRSTLEHHPTHSADTPRRGTDHGAGAALHHQPEGTARRHGGELLLRKEVIQPHLPVRLPCYDFVPIADPAFDGSLPQGVGPPASGVTDFRDVTGGVYKARERIHRSVADLRLLATPTSWGRVADPNPN